MRSYTITSVWGIPIRMVERAMTAGEFDGYRSYGQHWMADPEEVE